MQTDLIIEFNYDELMSEFFYFLDTPGQLREYSNHNKIVKYFQQDLFYATEKKLWKCEDIQNRLIYNRMKYLNKTTFTTDELLAGFKKSGIHYGYSHFNPLLAKWFYEKYNIISSYDPCGGWGHRLLGSLNLDHYIYNDISGRVCKNIKAMTEFFDIHDIKIYNKDASTFIPDENFEAIFTCPPYRNLEKYEIESGLEGTNKLLNHIFQLFLTNPTCKYLGLVIREDMNPLPNPNEIFDLNSNNSHFIKRKKHSEKLYVYKKN